MSDHPDHTHSHHRPGDVYRSGSFEARFPKLAHGDKDEPTEERKQKAIERMDVAGESQYVALRQQFGMDRGIPDHLEKDKSEPKKTWKEGEQKDANSEAGEGPLFNTMNPYAPDATVIGDSEKDKGSEVKETDFGGKAENSASLTTSV